MRCSALLLGLLTWGHVNVESDAQFPNNMVNYQYPAAAAPAWSPPMQYPQVPQQRQQYPPRQQQMYPQQQRWFSGPPQQTWLGRQPERTIYQTGWIPIRDMDSMKPAAASNVAAAGYAGGAGQMSESAAQEFLRRYYPNLFNRRWQAAPGPQMGDPYSSPIPRGPIERPWQPGPTYYDGRIHEVTATCNRRRCYKGCRLMLLGGGRCTAGGCMCYHAYFDQEGSPISRVHPEDNLWFALSSYERSEVLDAMRSGVPRRTSEDDDDNGRGMSPPDAEVPEEDDTEWFGDGDDIEATTTSQEGLIYYDVEDYNDDDSSEFGGEDNNGESETSESGDPFAWDFNQIDSDGDEAAVVSTQQSSNANAFGGDDGGGEEDNTWFGSGEDDDDDTWEDDDDDDDDGFFS